MGHGMDDVNERDLIGRCRAGDEAAFGELVDRYKDLIFAIIARTVPDRRKAEDLAQEVFLRVHRGLPYIRGDARLSTWIYRITANVCLQIRERQDPAVISIDGPAADSERRPREPGARDGAFDAIELRDRLDKAVAQLPAQDRFLIAAHYLQGVQYEDLADAAGIPLGTVKTHLYRAKRRLREILEGM